MSVITQDPLVSVIVISYNSAGTITETLESLKNQSYKNLQIIFTDDHSADNTVEVVQEWMQANENVHCHLLTAEQNGGISANCNRGLKAASGAWFKIIAADDVLLPDAITDNMNFVQQNPHAKMIQSLCELHLDHFGSKKEGIQPEEKKYKFFELESGLEQYKFILTKGNYIYAPAMFLNTEFVKNLGGFDERYKFMEDYPLWLKATRNNEKIYLLKKITVGYRVHSKSVMKHGKPFMSAKFAKESIYFLETFFEGKERNFRVKKEIAKYKMVAKMDDLGLNRPGLVSKVLYHFVLNL